MQKLQIHNKNNDISEKGQKIVGALYLVTSHLSDSDPLKGAVRSKAVVLLDTTYERTIVVVELTNLLKSCAIAKLISDTNASILIRELTYFGQMTSDQLSLTSFFAESPLPALRTNTMSYKQMKGDTVDGAQTNISIKSDTKNKRQDQILSFINGRKSAVIKDISSLFPDVSEKTIQRELGTLVDSGKITKRGSKRWSIYMAI